MVDSIVSAVRDNAMLRPDRVAVIADDEKITYAQLWREVQGLAAYIESFGFDRCTWIHFEEFRDPSFRKRPGAPREDHRRGGP